MIPFTRATLLVAPLFLGLSTGPAAAEVSFTKDVAPIFVKRCTACHGERINLGGYRMHTFQALSQAGASKKPSIVPGKPEQSEVFRLLTHSDPKIRMPKSDDPLSPEQIAVVRKWIVEGAKFDHPDRTALLKSLLGPRQHPAAPASYRVPAPVLALTLVPGGKEVVVGGYHEATIWNTQTGALVRRIPHLPQRIQSLAFSRDGKRLLVGGGTPGEYGEVTLVDYASGKILRVLDTFSDIVLSATFSPDETQVAAGAADAAVRAYDLASGKIRWANKVHSDWVTSVSFSMDGRFVASASKDHTVKIYETKDGSLFTTYNGHKRQLGMYRGQHPVYAVQFVDALLR